MKVVKPSATNAGSATLADFKVLDVDIQEAIKTARKKTKNRKNFTCVVVKSPYNEGKYSVKCMPAKLSITKKKIKALRGTKVGINGKKAAYSESY